MPWLISILKYYFNYAYVIHFFSFTTNAMHSNFEKPQFNDISENFASYLGHFEALTSSKCSIIGIKITNRVKEI